MYPIIFIAIVAVFLSLALVFVLMPFKKNFYSFLMSLIVILSVIAGYAQWGNYTAWLTYENQKARQSEVKTLLETMKGTDMLIIKLKEKARETPDNPKGWFLLGRLYASKEAWTLAAQSFTKAHRLAPEDVATTVNYGQALWQKNNRQFTEEIRRIFQELLQKNQDQPDALAMLAMDFYEQGNFTKAIELWEHLLTLTTPSSPEAKAIQEAIGHASQKL